MKRLATIAVTGVMSFMLSACGGDDMPKGPEAKPDEMMQAQPAAAPQENMQPAQPQPTAAPTDEQVEAATAQE